jgi:quinol monooxygenase YgiN
MQTCCPVVELRRYKLHPGRREALICLFDREFVETQEAAGISVIGQFRDLDDPDKFVWLRGFSNMSSRAEALKAFYGGPVWAEHKDAANATMFDSDDVLLLRPARPTSGFAAEGGQRPPAGAAGSAGGLVTAAICHPDAPEVADLLAFFEGALVPALKDTGAPPLAYFVTETSKNNYPALPVREDERVFVWFSLFADEAAYDRHIAAFSARAAEVSEALGRRLRRPPEVLRLSPTARSRVHG